MMTNGISLSNLNNSNLNSNRTMMNMTNIQQKMTAVTSASLVDRLAELQCVRSLAEMYSGLMEETITPHFTLHLIHAQVATFAAIAPFDMPILARLATMVWMGAALFITAKAYKK